MSLTLEQDVADLEEENLRKDVIAVTKHILNNWLNANDPEPRISACVGRVTMDWSSPEAVLQFDVYPGGVVVICTTFMDNLEDSEMRTCIIPKHSDDSDYYAAKGYFRMSLQLFRDHPISR